MSFKRIYIKFNNGGVFNYMDPEGFNCNITNAAIQIIVSHTGQEQYFTVSFSKTTIAYYRYEQMESGNGTQQ